MLSHSTKGSAKHADVDKSGRSYKNRKRESIRNSNWTASSSLTQQSFRALVHPKLRAAKLQVKQTFWYSLTLMQETSDTNLLSVLVKQKLTDLLHRVSQNRSTTCPEDALQMISLVLLQSLLYSARLRTNKIYISESYRIGEY